MSTQKGKSSENIACFILTRLGHTILERNFHSHYGEIDIITQKGTKIHIIEVKSSFNTHDPSENFSKTKLKRLTKTVKVYCYKNKIKESCIQIDLLVLHRLQNTYRLTHNANLFFH